MRKHITARLGLLLAVLLLFVPTAQAQTGAKTPENLLALASKSVGVVQCQPALARMAGLALVGATSHDILFDWDKKQPNQGPFFSLIGMTVPTGGAMASVIVVPKPNGECVVFAERFTAPPFSCESIAQVELLTYKKVQLIPGFAVYTSKEDPFSTVNLIDSPPSCLVLRRYVQYDWKSNPATPSMEPKKK
jgi:hypothetical protein